MKHFRQDDINHNTLKLLFKEYKNLPEELSGSIENLIAFGTIDQFTLLKKKKTFYLFKKPFFKKHMIDLNNIMYNGDTEELEYKLKNTIYTFNMLSDYFDDNTLLVELTSSKRYGECANRSLELVYNLKTAKILIGYVTIVNKKCLHAVVEMKIKNKECIFDWTRNLIISKDQYIKLAYFDEISSLDSEKLKNDVEQIYWHIKIGTIPYLIFREELINDMNRNPDFFINNMNK